MGDNSNTSVNSYKSDSTMETVLKISLTLFTIVVGIYAFGYISTKGSMAAKANQ